MEPVERIVCQWCQSQNEKAATSCRTCGAPLDVRDLVSDSGWREAPRIRDMTEFRFGASVPLFSLSAMGSGRLQHIWLRLWGPGRVAVQSVSENLEGNVFYVQRSSSATAHQW
jgi:hypothetical protein